MQSTAAVPKPSKTAEIIVLDNVNNFATKIKTTDY